MWVTKNKTVDKGTNPLSTVKMEARSGIEPLYKLLQSSA